jgi:hypothetical protein
MWVRDDGGDASGARMPDGAHRVAAVAALLAASCGGPEVDFYVHDTGVVVATDAPFARAPEFPARLESTIDASLAYWGGEWRALGGRTITLTGEAHVSCGGSERALGCHDGVNIRVTTVDPGTGTCQCVEQTVLVHEIGHAVIGDRNHEDPRWMQLEPVRDRLQGRIGYTAAGEVDCAIFVSVWRHPLGTP